MHGNFAAGTDPHAAQGVAAYGAVDFSLAGPAAGELAGGIDHDLALSRIRLSDHAGAVPADLTPNMASWYRATVEGPRRAALDAVEAQAASLNQIQSGSGIFLERELDRIEQDRLTQKRQVVASHAEKNQANFQRLDTARQGYQTAKRQYESLHARYNRGPVIVRWWYYAALALIGVAELMINYETFASIRFFTPAIALGTALVVAAALAFSSHCWGTLLRQLSVLSDPSQNDADRWATTKLMGLGALSLALVLGIVWYARESFFADLMAEMVVMSGEAPSRMKIIGGSLLSNLVVWAVGAILAYFAHDRDPRFPAAFKHMESRETQMRALQTTLDRPLQREFERIDAGAKNRRTEAQNQHEAHGHLPEHQLARRGFERIAEQDARVMSILESYRRQLVSRMAAEARQAGFERAAQVYPSAADTLEAADYAALPLRMKFL